MDNLRQTGLFALGVLSGALAASLFWSRKASSSGSQQLRKAALNINSEQYKRLKEELLVRVYQYFGKVQMAVVEQSYVVVFGAGGVGSNVVNMLIRSGVGRIRIIDFDRVSLSSLSRHAYAVREDVGSSKVLCMKKYIQKILPHIKVQAVDEFVNPENVERLIPEYADYVIDCIDNMDAKIALIATCVKKNIKLLVSGGAGMKNDTTRLQICDISECKNDELITAVRKKLNRLSIRKGVMVAYCQQETVKELLPLNEEQEKNPQSFKVFDNYRIRIIPVLGTMPTAIAATIASYVLCDLCGEPYDPYVVEDVKNTLYQKIHNRVLSDEKKLGVDADDFILDIDDVYLLMRHIFEWTCFITHKKELKQYYITRWNPQKPVSLFNAVVLGKNAYDRHIACKTLEQAGYDQATLHRMSEKHKLIEDYKAKKHVNYK